MLLVRPGQTIVVGIVNITVVRTATGSTGVQLSFQCKLSFQGGASTNLSVHRHPRT